MIPEQLLDETEQKDELLFVLHHRDAPTVVFLECNSYAKREELSGFLKQNLTEYQFHDIDVTRFSVISLLRVLTENLPSEIVNSKPVRYVINVYGLENSLLVSEDGQIKPSLLTAQLNLERELLFRNVPYIIIIWADHLFFQTLQRESPDLWSWVVYRFRFEGPEAVDPENAPPLPPERLPQQGNIAERKQRIQELEARYNQLNLDTSDKKRLLKDKVTILKLLAEEYMEAFRYDEAQTAYQNAIAIAERMQEDDHLRGNLYFNLAGVHLTKRQFSKALSNYEKCLCFANEDNHGVVYHQIGIVYAEQRQWTQALTNYQLALDWKEKTGNTYELGSTYDNVGIVYAQQRQWTQALTNYQLALDRKKKTGNTYTLGNTYYQIGGVYEDQQQWQQAEASYLKALLWKKKVGNTYQLSSAYLHIGIVYEEQQNWVVALSYYQMSLKWNEQTGNSYELGFICHQIGRVYEVLSKPEEAIEWYRSAIDNITLHGLEDQLPVAQESLARVESQLGTQPVVNHDNGKLSKVKAILLRMLAQTLRMVEPDTDKPSKDLFAKIRNLFRRS